MISFIYRILIKGEGTITLEKSLFRLLESELSLQMRYKDPTITDQHLKIGNLIIKEKSND